MSVTRLACFIIALVLIAFSLSACSWVDSTGVQTTDDPANDDPGNPNTGDNQPPMLTADIPDIMLLAGVTLNPNDQRNDFARFFSDPDGNVLSFGVSQDSLPASGHLVIDANGKLSGRPTEDDIGQYVVRLNVSDGLLSVEQSFVLTIQTLSDGVPNSPPVINPIEDVTVFQGREIRISISATDPENDAIRFSLGGNTPNFIDSQQDDDNLILSGRARISGSFPIAVTAADDMSSSTESFFLFVIAQTNTPPQVDDIPNITVTDEFEYDVSEFFFDPDNDEITFSSNNLPPDVSISADGNIAGESTSSNRGNHFVTIFADDGFDELVTDSFRLRIR